ASSRDRTLTLLTGSGQIHATGYLDDPTVGRNFPDATGKLLAVLEGDTINGWVRRLKIPVVVQSEYRTMPLTLLGVEPGKERAISVLPDSVASGHYLLSSDDPMIVLGQRLVDRLKTRIGKRVIILAQATDGSLAERSFEVSGIFDGNIDIEEQFAFVGLAVLQPMLGTGKSLSEIAFRITDDNDLDQVIASLQAVSGDLDIRSWRDLSPMAAMIDETTEITILIWMWVMFVLMAIGIVNTQLMAVYERVREFGLLQALGMRPRMILIIVTLESAMLVGLGVVIGITAAVVSILAMSEGIDIGFLAEGAAMIGVGSMLFPKLDFPQIIELSAVIWVLGVVVALWPARKAAKSSPVEAMSHVS
ncbi:MAG: ABC transporter permease, partial [Paracoccaceae bacterium]